MKPNSTRINIVFLCGCLQPGADGVGDYTRRLAEQLIQQGHKAAMIALNDRYVTEKAKGMQDDEAAAIPVLRLPAAWPESRRFAEAKAWIEQKNPDWLSLQFVAFAFQPKGLPFGLSKRLKILGEGRKWHVMFHELWTGMSANDTVKQKLLGAVQKRLIKRLVNVLQPATGHTQCTLYVQKLKEEGFAAKRLPLFSNVPTIETNCSENACINELKNEPKTRFVFFGGLHPQSQLNELIAELRNASLTKFEFIYAGRNGGELQAHENVLKKDRILYRILGELPPKDVSALLSICDFGVSTTSPAVIEKSGTVAALLQHGLPVICIGRAVRIKNFIASGGAAEGLYYLEDTGDLLRHRPTVHSTNTSAAVAETFLNDIGYRATINTSKKSHHPASL